VDHRIFIAFQSIKKKDSSKFRKLLFNEYRKKYLLSQFFYLAYGNHIFRPAVVLLLVVFSLRKVISVDFKPNRNLSEIYIHNYSNEKKSILRAFEDAENASELTYTYSLKNLIKNWRVLFGQQFNLNDISKFIKICSNLSKKNSFLVTARQIEFLSLYIFYRNFFKNIDVKKIYISSESNPEIISAALGCINAKINYTNHGYLNSDLGVFFQDKLVLDSRPLKNRIAPHLLNQEVEFEIIKKSQAQLIKPLIDTQNILILGSLVLDINYFSKLINDCQKHLSNSHITVRPHPNKTFADPKYLDLCKRYKISINPHVSLNQQLSDSTLVIAGETSAHLDALAQGVPSIYYRLDQFPQDHYGFISSGLIPEVKSLDGLKNSIQKFYSNPEWLKVYKDYFGE